MKSTFLKALLVTFLLLPFMGCKDDDKAPAPVANFSFTPTSPKAGEEVIFIDESTNATSYEWNFGDNTTSTQKNPRKTYAKEGTYTVKLKVKGEGGEAETSKNITVGAATVVLSGNITTNTTLEASKVYILQGQVNVQEGATLTIQAGTIIKGDKRTRGTLVIRRGARIVAEGTKEKPIVMTSAQDAGARDKGDWGGLVILGRARVNQPDPAVEGIEPAAIFGGTNDADNSGILRYVRIEYAGIELTPNNETNSLTLGGVGSGTVVEYVQVSYGGDDGFEWFGGTVNGKYLVSLGTWDDDFDCDYGWSGNIQFALAVRAPFLADQSQSNAFECDNGPNDNDVQPYTTATFSNVTVLGPRDIHGRGISANYANGVHVRRRTAVTIANSIITGFATGVRMDNLSTFEQYARGNGIMYNNRFVVAGTGTTAPTTVAVGTGIVLTDLVTYLSTNRNTFMGGTAINADSLARFGLKAANYFGSRSLAQYPANPDFSVTTGSLLNAARFDIPKLQVAFFDKSATYIGAFGNTDWTDGWTEFVPLNATYQK